MHINRGGLLIIIVLAILLVNVFLAHYHIIGHADSSVSTIFSSLKADQGHKDKQKPPQGIDAVISTLILTYNNSAILDDILYSLLHQVSPVRVEIVVFDNGCFPSTQQVVRKHQLVLASSSGGSLWLRYMPLCANEQYASAYNKAAESVSSSSQWLLLLNDDVIPRDNLFHNFHLLHDSWVTMRSVEEVGAVGCKLLFPSKRIVEAGSLVRADGTTDNFLRWELGQGWWHVEFVYVCA